MLKPTAKVVMTGALKGGGLGGRLASLTSGPNQVHVGFPAGEVGSDIVQRAVWQEFGTRGGGWGGPIPERPFIGNAARRNRGKYQHAMAAAAREIIRGLVTGKSGAAMKRQALTKLGIFAAEDIRAEIDAMSNPPNSPVTIALKKSSKPLIDTGEMRRAITWKVDE